MIRRRRRHGRAPSSGLVILVVLALAGCSGDGEGEEADALLQQGLQAQAAGDLAAAEDAYLQVIQLDPRNKFAYYNLGVIEQGRGELPAAESHYRTTLGLDPDFVPALFNLAILMTDAGSAEEATSLYEHLIEVMPIETASPEDVKLVAAAHLNLGFLLIEQGREGRGQKELEEAVRLDPSLEDRIDAETSSEVPVSAGATPAP